ncbi:MAG: hypothetical protein K0U66_03595 [Gammaproteobacteria bacterium]|nr:hypothetical protein [Gammaproteobacteria bacterium]
MTSTRIKQTASTLLLALLLSAQGHSVHGREVPPPENADEEPVVYIYYLGTMASDLLSSNYIPDLIDLDGGPGKPRWGCLVRPPDSLQFYNAVYPLLADATEGYCEIADTRIKIVNKTSGEHIYIDRFGGLYFYGDTITRKMSDEDFFTVRKMLAPLQNCSYQ